jgi:hypothetical protein
MYLQHFKLNEMPFSLTPDTAFFMGRAGYREALNVLLVALRSGEGFMKVVGEVGTGKTILCRTLLKNISEEFACAYLPNPYLRPASLLLSIADELGIEYPKRASQHQLLKRLNEGLLQCHAEGRRVMVCMDEAQAVPLQTLEALRLLTTLETEKTTLLQVVAREALILAVDRDGLIRASFPEGPHQKAEMEVNIYKGGDVDAEKNSIVNIISDDFKFDEAVGVVDAVMADGDDGVGNDDAFASARVRVQQMRTLKRIP